MRSNPFSSKWIQPGAIEYHFFDRHSVESLIERFLNLRSRRGMIVGPHGSGKSTLVNGIQKFFQENYPEIALLHQRFTREPGATRRHRVSTCEWPSDSIVILDGFEQVSYWSRWRIYSTIHRKKIRLLVTLHKSLRRFDLLWTTNVDQQSAEWLVRRMLDLSGQPELEANVRSLLDSKEWAESRARHGQNIRETLFDMYDWWQIHTDR